MAENTDALMFDGVGGAEMWDQNWKIISCPLASCLGLLDLSKTGGDSVFSEVSSSWGKY